MTPDWRRVRSRRFSDDWVPPPSTLIPFLEDDDDDDDDYAHTEKLLETTTTMTPEFGFEFITIPGRGARPWTSSGLIIAATVAALLILLMLVIVISFRWRRKRHSVTHDKIPLTVSTGEGYSPYNVETDGMNTGSVYTQLDQPADCRFPTVRTSQVSSQLVMRITSIHCDYDEPQPVIVSQVRSRPRTNRLSEYDVPDFSLANGTAMGVLGCTSTGALEVTQPDEAYYSSLQEVGGQVPTEAASRQNDVYYSSIKSNEKEQTTAVLSEVTGSANTTSAEQRPFYFTLERSGNNRLIRSSKDGDEEANGDNLVSEDEDATIKYDYLQLTTTEENSSAAPDGAVSTCRDDAPNTDYLKLTDSHSGFPDAATTPPSGDSGQVEKCAGKGDGSQSESAVENIYNTLQRRKQSTAIDTEEIYNVLSLE